MKKKTNEKEKKEITQIEKCVYEVLHADYEIPPSLLPSTKSGGDSIDWEQMGVDETM